MPIFSLNKAANLRLIKHLEGGGVKNIMYGGNANLPCTAGRIRGPAGPFWPKRRPDTWCCPRSARTMATGAMEQAKIIKASAYPTAMLLPMTFPYTDAGIATGVRHPDRRDGQEGRRLHQVANYLKPDTVAKLCDEGRVAFDQVRRRDGRPEG